MRRSEYEIPREDADDCGEEDRPAADPKAQRDDGKQVNIAKNAMVQLDNPGKGRDCRDDDDDLDVLSNRCRSPPGVNPRNHA